jgi:hypothetical protein
LPEGAIGGVAHRFQVTDQGIADLVATHRFLRIGRDGCGNGTWLNNFQDSCFNGIVHPQAAEGNATWLTIIEPAPAATVARNIVFCAGVADRQFAPAAAASDQTSKQRVALFGGAMMPAVRGVIADHSADRLQALPTDIALMCAGVQC